MKCEITVISGPARLVSPHKVKRVGWMVLVNGKRPSGWVGATIFPTKRRARDAARDWCKR